MVCMQYIRYAGEVHVYCCTRAARNPAVICMSVALTFGLQLMCEYCVHTCVCFCSGLQRDDPTPTYGCGCGRKCGRGKGAHSCPVQRGG